MLFNPKLIVLADVMPYDITEQTSSIPKYKWLTFLSSNNHWLIFFLKLYYTLLYFNNKNNGLWYFFGFNLLSTKCIYLLTTLASVSNYRLLNYYI